MFLIAFSAFLLVVLIMIVKEVMEMVFNVKHYFKSLWNAVDICIILMTFGCIIVYLVWQHSIRRLLDTLEELNHNQYVSYSSLFQTQDILTAMSGALICVATVRLWKFLRFVEKFRIMERTLLYAAVPFLAMFIFHLITLLGFVFVGYLFFGTYTKDFKSIQSSINTLVFHSIGVYYDLDFETLDDVHGIIGFFYYVLYMFFTITVFSLYVTIIIMANTRARVSFSNKRKYYTVKDFVKDEVLYYFDLCRVKAKRHRLRAGGIGDNVYDKIYPKADAHRYAKCSAITTNRMNAMTAVARAVIKNHYYANVEDPMFIGDVVYYFNSKDRQNDPKAEIFFKSRKDDDVKLVDDRRLMQMEIVTRRMLTGQDVDYTLRESTVKFDYIKDSLNVALSIINSIAIDDYDVFVKKLD